MKPLLRLRPILKILIPKWNQKVWNEDFGIKIRRQKMLDMNFKDFVFVHNEGLLSSRIYIFAMKCSVERVKIVILLKTEIKRTAAAHLKGVGGDCIGALCTSIQ